MKEGWGDVDAFDGSCQCGACRYEVTEGQALQTVCHCRMCQRATGNAFAPLIAVETAHVTWEGMPKLFQSSNLAQRGFCGECGTPLFYQRLGCGEIEFMVGTINSDFNYSPVRNHGAESRLGWVLGLANVTERETFFDDGETVVSHQYEHGG